MAKFCVKCGKKLENEEVCNCTTNNPEKTNNISSIVHNIISLIKGMFVSPVDTIQSFIHENNFINALISIGISAVAGATTVYFLFARIISLIFYLLGLSGLSNIYNYYSSSSSFRGFDIPYIKIIIITIISVIIFNALMVGIVYFIITKICKKEANYKVLTTWLGTSAGLLTVVYLIVSLCISMDLYYLAFIIYGLGNGLVICYQYKGLKFVSNIDENKVAYVFISALILSTIILNHILNVLI